ncbi:MAG: UDP-2-acetamido-3-amino-2,3-dideoxy-glucuronate N-acetyltransferase [Verrucomicrobiales bacterium]|jgi:UDP-2-acetamido-3-amino-2,3-dideoxy-glucuronate N-acetyltransferase
MPPTSTRTRSSVSTSSRIHPTAIIENGVKIGQGTSVWDNVHIRFDTVIGKECIIGEKTYVAYKVKIGDRVKLNANVYIPTGVTIEDGVMISAGTVLTNDRFPRATTPDLKELRPSDPDEETLETTIKAGATIGANCTIACGITIGRWAMIGMGSCLTRCVPDFHLCYGHPAKPAGLVCKCGKPTYQFEDGIIPRFVDHIICPCGLKYRIAEGIASEA